MADKCMCPKCGETEDVGFIEAFGQCRICEQRYRDNADRDL